ncbi:hypothetical protein Tco_0394748 [Tanacetum coccineum]
MEYVIPKYGKCNWREDNSWSQIILEDIYNTIYKDKAEANKEAELTKESEDMALSIMKEKFLSMVEFEKATISMIRERGKVDDKEKRKVDDKEKGKVDDKGKGKVDEKGKEKVDEKGNAKQAEDDVDLVDADLVDALDLQNKIKRISEDFNMLLKAKKAKEAELAEVVKVSGDEEDSSDEDFLERPTTSRAPIASTSTRSRAPTACTRSRAPITSTSNAQAASTTPKWYMKIYITGCVLSLRAPNDPNAPPASTTQKRNP